jgi:hypothetical protein
MLGCALLHPTYKELLQIKKNMANLQCFILEKEINQLLTQLAQVKSLFFVIE